MFEPDGIMTVLAVWAFGFFLVVWFVYFFVYAPIKFVYYIVQAFRGKAKIGSSSDINYTNSEMYFGSK